MTGTHRLQTIAMTLVAGVALLFTPARAYAHCDSMDGPVVKAAQSAIALNNLAPVLIWVPAADEPEVRRVFAQTLEVRQLSAQAAAMADRHFFETVVRIHRMGEGEPYTGLKPAGSYSGLAVPAVDRALVSGSVAELRAALLSSFNARLDEYFATARAKRAFSTDDVAAGREYVEAYVRLAHFAEEMETLTSGAAHGGDAAAVHSVTRPGAHQPY